MLRCPALSLKGSKDERDMFTKCWMTIAKWDMCQERIVSFQGHGIAKEGLVISA